MRRGILFVGLLALALLALLPLRWVLAATPVTARSVSGSLWSGRLAAAALPGLPIGDVAVGLSPLGLFSGAARFVVDGDTIDGAMLLRRGGRGIEHVTGRLTPGRIAGLQVAAIDLADVSAGFAAGACTRAMGQVNLLPAGPLQAAGALFGTPRCDGAALLLPLTSPHARLDLRILADGHYTAALALTGIGEAERVGLLATGFQATPDGLALTVTGQF
ncbi:MAG: hypothetical protein RL490_1364 [Pseudomonadota bacterium]|jgi:general secretion pathway protein N